MKEYQRIQVTPLAPPAGAEIDGVDLTARLDAEVIDEIYRALIEHLVVFFRGQDITPVQHIAFARGFGELQPPHPIMASVEGFKDIMVLENEEGRQLKNNEWHSDQTFLGDPPFGSILHAKRMPPCGGDTLWASMYAAYDALSESVKELLSGLTAVHDMGQSFRDYLQAQDDGGERLRRTEAATPPVEHPIVRPHAVTGRPVLFVNDTFTSHIVGMEKRESDAILNMLYRHIETPEFQVRFKWRENDVAFWDNRATQHYAIADYFPQYRRIHRVTLATDRGVHAAAA